MTKFRSWGLEIGTLTGLVLVVFAVVYAAASGGGSAGAFVDYASIVCVVGGSLATLLIAYPLKTVLNLGGVYRAAVVRRPPDSAATIGVLVELAEIARRDGLLALEAHTAEITNPFIVTGVRMTVDGTRPEILEESLRTEMEATARRHTIGKGALDTVGKYAPAFGMIGTLVGLVMMLGNMNDPDAIGPGMAVALLTTLYGALLANGVCLPLADKLSYLNKQELIDMEIVVKGILGIQSGDNPRLIEQRLGMYLPADEREALRRPRVRPEVEEDVLV